MAQILIIEDYPSIQQIYKQSLEKAGHTALTASNAATALELAKTHPLDLILLDLLLPDMDGMELLRQLRQGKAAATKVIVTSNMDTPQLQEQARQLGVVAYLLKATVTPRQLVSTVATVLEGKASAGN